METITNIVAEIDWNALIAHGVKILLILFLSWIAMKILKRLLVQLEKRLLKESLKEGEPPSESHKRIDTLVRLLKKAAYITLWLVALLVLLTELGVKVGPLIAGAGILGLAIGFGAQNLVRDVISGFFLILENQIRVGDVAVINGTGGLVERIHFRTTVLRDLAGLVHVFPNGEITSLSNLTKEWSAYVFDIGVAYKENTDRVIEVMKQVGEEMRNDETIGPYMLEDIDIFGVDKFADSAVVIKGRLKTKPIRQWQVGREFLRRIKLAFDEQGIEIPFPHRTLYVGDESKPFDLRILEKLQHAGREGK
jgi:small conductance mechanosensitive channel